MSKDINSFEYFKEMAECWTRDELLQRCYDLCKEIVDKNQQIIIMEKYLELIYDLGFDYDGCGTIEGLKELIDDLVHCASLGRACNTTESIYTNMGKHYNILHEEIEGKK